ncbi:regulatory protein, luxR family [Vibrio xiamenensis]|uniref:Regulatory protein, luxR family n=1 Tax=Vibrio xiamenensis TaxID=861298 RepID=A0A1G7XKA4_9VIBR|nr:helix-turn-helix transcriptional regulator [Vibrio xiamenensis]SDG84506.1 regulatory protein, luxR family [Vibrio xiamenensis]
MDNQFVSLLKQIPGYWGCKNMDSVFVYVNQSYSELVGFSSPEQCIGLSDCDLPSPTAKCAEAFKAQDRLVVETGQELKILDIHPYPDGRWRAHIFTKRPWFDYDGKVQGTIFFAQDLTDAALLEIGHWVCQSAPNPNISPVSNQAKFAQLSDKLSPREAETLFLLLCGKKPQFIADVMNISVKTFEGYIVKLREKFEVLSKVQLIEKALEYGFGSHIPQSLLKTQLSVVLNMASTAQNAPERYSMTNL